MSTVIGILLSVCSALLGFFLCYFVLRYINRAYEVSYTSAQSHLQNRQYEQAISCFRETLRGVRDDNPIYLSSLVGLAEAFSGIGDSEKALDYFDKAIQRAKEEKNRIFEIQLVRLKDNLIASTGTLATLINSIIS